MMKLSSSVYFDIDNVARWCYRNSYPAMIDLLLPPYDNTIFEYNVTWADGRRQPVLAKASVRNDLLAELPKTGRNMPHAEHGIILRSYSRVRETRNMEIGVVSYLCNKDGRCIHDSFYPRPGTLIIDNPTFPSDEEGREGMLGSVLYPVYLALNLLHCKNVSVVDRKPSRQIVRRHQRKGKKPIIYKTLVVDLPGIPVKGKGKNTGMPRRLHLVRGNFANYDDKPLFGKYTGTYWRPAHVRGSKTVGEIRKDYKLRYRDN